MNYDADELDKEVAEYEEAEGVLKANVESFVTSLKSIGSNMSSVNSLLSSTQDTIMNNEALAHSSKVSETANTESSKIESEASAAYTKIEQKIQELKNQAQADRSKAATYRELARQQRIAAQKKKNQKNNSNTNTETTA